MLQLGTNFDLCLGWVEGNDLGLGCPYSAVGHHPPHKPQVILRLYECIRMYEASPHSHFEFQENKFQIQIQCLIPFDCKSKEIYIHN